MQHTTAKHNPLTFYLRMLLYMFVALLLRLLALAPLACLFVFPAGSPLKLLALLCPVLLVLLVLPLSYSFAEAMVRRDGSRYFSFDTALNLGNYGEKLAESLLHAAHVIKWGIPFFAMLIYGYYWYKEVDALTLLSTLTQLGRGWTNTWCSVANFFLGLVGGAQLTPPQNTLMDGVAAVLAVLGLGVAVWLYGAVRNSAARYVWAYANRNDHSPRKELRRRLRGRRLAQLGVSLINLRGGGADGGHYPAGIGRAGHGGGCGAAAGRVRVSVHAAAAHPPHSDGRLCAVGASSEDPKRSLFAADGLRARRRGSARLYPRRKRNPSVSAVRLDKYLAQSGERTRSQAVRAIRDGLARINGTTVRDPAAKVGEGDEVTLAGEPVYDEALQYYMLHKPAGVLTAARDGRAQTVMDLVPPALLHRRVLPVGRLDKDTTGILILTNDGALAHALLAPGRHVWKRYVACVTGRLDGEDTAAFAAGVPLSDFTALPATLTILCADESESRAVVEVREGKYHQIKRMFSARGHEVTALHRASFGPLELPDDLPPGGLRRLSAGEVAALRAAVLKPNDKEG